MNQVGGPNNQNIREADQTAPLRRPPSNSVTPPSNPTPLAISSAELQSMHEQRPAEKKLDTGSENEQPSFVSRILSGGAKALAWTGIAVFGAISGLAYMLLGTTPALLIGLPTVGTCLYLLSKTKQMPKVLGKDDYQSTINVFNKIIRTPNDYVSELDPAATLKDPQYRRELARACDAIVKPGNFSTEQKLTFFEHYIPELVGITTYLSTLKNTDFINDLATLRHKTTAITDTLNTDQALLALVHRKQNTTT